VKARRAAQFLDHGDRVKVTVRFRGREISHANLGRDLLMRMAELLAEHGVIERQPLLEGRSMYIVMGPLEKRPEKKTDAEGEGVSTPAGETIGDAIAAKAPPAAAASAAEATSEAPAQQGT
jgi:translation initiation factor IF-3